MACNIDHSLQDVQEKLQSQREFLPENIYEQIVNFLDTTLSQETLNEVFHLLKKYDLSETEEKEKRNKAFEALFATTK